MAQNGVASAVSTTMADRAPTAISNDGEAGAGPPWVSGATAATVSHGKNGSHAASAPPRASPATMEKATATPAPTRNGQPGVLRYRRALRTSGGPAASSSTTIPITP